MSAARMLSVLNSQLLMLPYKFGDADTAKERAFEIEKKFELKAERIFESQRAIDLAKKAKLSRGQFRTLVCRYFQKHIGANGFDVPALERDMRAHKDTFERHLGREWVYFLSTLIKLHKEIDQREEKRPRGLLQVVT